MEAFPDKFYLFINQSFIKEMKIADNIIQIGKRE